jgi:hypothetical protein
VQKSYAAVPLILDGGPGWPWDHDEARDAGTHRRTDQRPQLRYVSQNITLPKFTKIKETWQQDFNLIFHERLLPSHYLVLLFEGFPNLDFQLEE